MKQLSEQPDITAIIVNYKTADLTNAAIKSILDGLPSISKEIFVIDNASNDGSPEKIRNRWDDQIIFLENDKNLGFASANNRAMHKAKGRYFFLLNSDAEIIDNSLEKMVQFADQNPDIGILGCKIMSEEGLQQLSCWRPPTLSHLLCRAFNLYRILPDGWFGSTNIEAYGKPTENKSVEAVSGCCMLVNREAAKQVGFFDERFFMYGEDTDWCTRMRESNFVVHFLSDAIVKHRGECSSANAYTAMRIELGKSVLTYIRKHSGRIHALAGNMLLGLFFLLRIPLWILAVAISKNRNKAVLKLKSYLNALWWHLKWPFSQMVSGEL